MALRTEVVRGSVVVGGGVEARLAAREEAREQPVPWVLGMVR